MAARFDVNGVGCDLLPMGDAVPTAPGLEGPGPERGTRRRLRPAPASRFG